MVIFFIIASITILQFLRLNYIPKYANCNFDFSTKVEDLISIDRLNHCKAIFFIYDIYEVIQFLETNSEKIDICSIIHLCAVVKNFLILFNRRKSNS